MILYLVIFQWNKTLIFELIACKTTMKISLRFLTLPLNVFVFNNNFCKQIDDIAMGSTTLFYRRYIDDIFIFFFSLGFRENFKKKLFS